MGVCQNHRRLAASLSFHAVYRRGVCESLKDGRVLLKVLDRLSPGCVDWRRTRNGPSRPQLKRVHSIETCNRVSHPACAALHCDHLQPEG